MVLALALAAAPGSMVMAHGQICGGTEQTSAQLTTDVNQHAAHDHAQASPAEADTHLSAGFVTDRDNTQTQGDDGPCVSAACHQMALLGASFALPSASDIEAGLTLPAPRTPVALAALRRPPRS